MRQSPLRKRDTIPLQTSNLLKDSQLNVESQFSESVLNAAPKSSKKKTFKEREAFQEIQENSFANLSAVRRKNIWDQEETERLIKLHDELGNKWSTISKRFTGKTQNDIKNRFFSQLRRGLRHLNKAVQKLQMQKIQPIKPSVLYKIIASCEDEFKGSSKKRPDQRDLAKELKSGIFQFLAKKETNQPCEVYQLLHKLRMFISIKNPHLKPKNKLQKQGPTSFHHSISEEEQPSQEVVLKKEPHCRIKQMKTVQESENELPIRQVVSEQLQTNQDAKFIEKPPICLNGPFELQNLWISVQGQNSWSIDHDIDKQPYVGFCYPEFMFPHNNNLL